MIIKITIKFFLIFSAWAQQMFVDSHAPENNTNIAED